MELLLVLVESHLSDCIWFLPQNFGRWRKLMNGTLSFYECRLGGGDTRTLSAVIKFILIYCTQETVGT